VHVTLVIHPRKENESSSLGMQSVFGSAKATQEADNVIILQQARNDESMNVPQVSNGFVSHMSPYRLLEVKKNRFDGDLGTIVFQFDKETCRAVEVDPSAVFAPPAPSRVVTSKAKPATVTSSPIKRNIPQRPPVMDAGVSKSTSVEEGAPLALGHEVLMG